MSQANNLTIQDITLTSEIKQEQYTGFIRTLAWLVYNNALLTTIGVNNPQKFPSIEDAFPTLFEKKEQQDWWIMKQRVEDWAKAKQLNREL